MVDKSDLDNYYFIDSYKYNCPFCNRNHVAYHITDYTDFDWSNDKKCRTYFAECDSCAKVSMHLSFLKPELIRHSSNTYRFSSDVKQPLDQHFFYSVPTSFFALDNRIPNQLREVLIEAEGCLKSNFLTGASACARKIIYELAVLHNASGNGYDEKIKSLKETLPTIEPSFFDSLLTIQQLTSSKVHENSYDGWESKHLRLILASIAEVLHEIYVIPALREDRRKKVLELNVQLTGLQANKKIEPEVNQD